MKYLMGEAERLAADPEVQAQLAKLHHNDIDLRGRDPELRAQLASIPREVVVTPPDRKTSPPYGASEAQLLQGLAKPAEPSPASPRIDIETSPTALIARLTLVEHRCSVLERAVERLERKSKKEKK